MVQLKDFVSETLRQIVEGVREAQKQLPKEGIAPEPFQPGGVDAQKLGGYIAAASGGLRLIQPVEFDVAVTVTEGSKTAGGIGVAVGLFNLGSGGQSTNETASVSRIRFKVPLGL